MNKFITHCVIGAGGSWAKGETPEATAAKLKQIILEDWGSIYDFSGQSTEVAIFDLPTDEDAYWTIDGGGLMVDGEWSDPVEHIEITF